MNKYLIGSEEGKKEYRIQVVEREREKERI